MVAVSSGLSGYSNAFGNRPPHSRRLSTSGDSCRALPLCKDPASSYFVIVKKAAIPYLAALVVIGCICGEAQGSPQTTCPQAETVLQRYIDAVGGAPPLARLLSRAAEADETEPASFKPQATETYKFRFKWKAPNKVAVKRTHIVPIFGVPVNFGAANFIFDGEFWSDFQGRANRAMQENEQEWRRRLTFSYPMFAMYKVAADPLMIARQRELYSHFELSEAERSNPGLCLVRATGSDGRIDLLYFDSVTGLLERWDLQIYQPGRSFYMRFSFGDYRESGGIKLPHYLYVDLYRATFRYTKVVQNARLKESDFVIK
jgi:hypothetical protein